MRYFATFNVNTSLVDKVMVFTGLTKQEVWDNLNKEYPKALDTIYSEPEFFNVIAFKYPQTRWVNFGEECKLFYMDLVTGKVHDELLATYPISKNIEPPRPKAKPKKVKP